MCFGSSKPKEVKPPPPSPPTTFDYSVANRGEPQRAVAAAAAPSQAAASFGSELAGTPAMSDVPKAHMTKGAI